jgi:hypothetical protein
MESRAKKATFDFAGQPSALPKITAISIFGERIAAKSQEFDLREFSHGYA